MNVTNFACWSSQVRNAQHAGASAVIIADNECLCSERCPATSVSQLCHEAAPIVRDDGSSGDVSIPSFLMPKKEADSVKAELALNHHVYMEMRWSLPDPDERVKYDVWTVPSDPASLNFFQKFKVAAMALGSKAYFTPYMFIHDGVLSNCDALKACYNLCTNGGRYCATVPDDKLTTKISGADIVRESLRRICIWKYYGEKDGIGEKWWDYVSNFTELCNTKDHFSQEDCVKDVYKKVGIDENIATRCINDSGGLTADRNNVLLDDEISSKYARGVVVMPSAFVDGVVLRSALTVDNVFVAICARFAGGTAPKICQDCAACSNPYECIKADGVCPFLNAAAPPVVSDSSRSSFWPALLLVSGVVVVGLGVWYYKNVHMTEEKGRETKVGIPANTTYTMLTGHDFGNPDVPDDAIELQFTRSS